MVIFWAFRLNCIWWIFGIIASKIKQYGNDIAIGIQMFATLNYM